MNRRALISISTALAIGIAGSAIADTKAAAKSQKIQPNTTKSTAENKNQAQQKKLNNSQANDQLAANKSSAGKCGPGQCGAGKCGAGKCGSST